MEAEEIELLKKVDAAIEKLNKENQQAKELFEKMDRYLLFVVKHRKWITENLTNLETWAEEDQSLIEW